MKQTSENKLFNPSLSLFAPNQARESGESKQSVPSDQISEPATTNDVLIVSLLQWHSSSMQWPTYPHRLTYQWTWFYVHMQINSEPATMASRKLTSSMSKSTSESASMTFFVNAMTYLPSSLYLPVNLILRSHANSEPATMTSRKLISSMSKSTSEPASMTFFVNAMTYLFSSLYLPVNRSTSRSRATSESALMTSR